MTVVTFASRRPGRSPRAAGAVARPRRLDRRRLCRRHLHAGCAILTDTTTETFATFDGDELIDPSTARRPRLRIENGIRTEIHLAGADDGRPAAIGSGRALPCSSGLSPTTDGAPSQQRVVEMAHEGSSIAASPVGLGGFPIAAPTPRPVRLTATASEPAARQEVWVRSWLDRGAGGNRGGARQIDRRCRDPRNRALEAGCRTTWLPMPFAPAALALVRGVRARSPGSRSAPTDWPRAPRRARRQVDELISQSERSTRRWSASSRSRPTPATS